MVVLNKYTYDGHMCYTLMIDLLYINDIYTEEIFTHCSAYLCDVTCDGDVNMAAQCAKRAYCYGLYENNIDILNEKENI